LTCNAHDPFRLSTFHPIPTAHLSTAIDLFCRGGPDGTYGGHLPSRRKALNPGDSIKLAWYTPRDAHQLQLIIAAPRNTPCGALAVPSGNECRDVMWGRIVGGCPQGGRGGDKRSVGGYLRDEAGCGGEWSATSTGTQGLCRAGDCDGWYNWYLDTAAEPGVVHGGIGG